MAHQATILQPGDEMYVGFMYPSGKYVEVKLMAGEDALVIESRNQEIEVVGGHICQKNPPWTDHRAGSA
jgi:hypothetical protein